MKIHYRHWRIDRGRFTLAFARLSFFHLGVRAARVLDASGMSNCGRIRRARLLTLGLGFWELELWIRGKEVPRA